MKTNLIILAVTLVALSGCDDEEIQADASVETVAKTYRAITLGGRKTDTAYLYGNYKDKGASVLSYVDGRTNCNDPILVSDVSGSVNMRLPGTYTLNYNANDTTGNPLPVITRTVHVVENSAGFLNGNYNVACSCTAIIAGLQDQTVTTDNYTATVSTGAVNHEFELIMLKIGPDYVVPHTSLNGNIIEVGYFSRDYAHGSASGTLAVSKNTFTIESKSYQFYPKITHLCKNVYTRQLIINDVAHK